MYPSLFYRCHLKLYLELDTHSTYSRHTLKIKCLKMFSFNKISLNLDHKSDRNLDKKTTECGRSGFKLWSGHTNDYHIDMFCFSAKQTCIAN